MKSLAGNDTNPSLANLQDWARFSDVEIVRGYLKFTVSVPLTLVDLLKPLMGLFSQMEGQWGEHNADVARQQRRHEVFTERADAQRREYMEIGRKASSQARRMKRYEELETRAALVIIASEMGLTFSHLESLVSLHNKARTRRIERSRASLIPVWLESGMSRKEIAERLNLTVVQVGRLIKGLQAQAGVGATC